MEKVKQSRVNSLGLAILKYVSMLLVVGSFISCLVPVPKVILCQGDSGPTCECSIKEEVDWCGL